MRPMGFTGTRRLLTHALCLAIFAMSHAAPARGEVWTGFGDAYFDATVYALAEFRGQLVAAGNFLRIGGRTVHHIARWDGQDWLSLGSGLQWDDPDRDPYAVWGAALLVHDDQLYVGGHFLRAGEVGAGNIARWDGSAWHPVGPGFDNRVYDLAVYRNSLIACGSFRWAGLVRVEHVARLSGGIWRIMESGVSFAGAALHVHNDFLYLGGLFSATGTGRPLERIGEWDGQTWRALMQNMHADDRGGPVTPVVLDFASHGGKLVFGGLFDAIDGQEFPSLAVYDGAAVRRLDADVAPSRLTHDRVFSLATHHGELIVGGLADAGSPSRLQQIARWDGTRFLEVGGGVNGTVQALLSTPSGLIVGGAFSSAGNSELPAIANWEGQIPVSAFPTGGLPRLELEDLGGSAVRLRVSLDRAEAISVEVYDLRGRRLARVFEGHASAGITTLQWDGRDDRGRTVARGRYQVRVGTGRGEANVSWTRLR